MKKNNKGRILELSDGRVFLVRNFQPVTGKIVMNLYDLKTSNTFVDQFGRERNSIKTLHEFEEYFKVSNIGVKNKITAKVIGFID